MNNVGEEVDESIRFPSFDGFGGTKGVKMEDGIGQGCQEKVEVGLLEGGGKQFRE